MADDKVSMTAGLQIMFRAIWRKYLQQKWHDLEWPIIVLFFLIILSVGYFSYKNYFLSLGDAKSLPDILYQTIQLFWLGSSYAINTANFELQVIRIFSPLMPFYMILKAIGVIFYDQINRFNLKWFVRNHVILCGVNERTLLLAKDFYERGYKIVSIEKNISKDMLDKCRELDSIVITGSPTDPEMLKIAKIQQARYLISFIDDDASNSEVAINALELTSGKKSKALNCFINISDPQLWSLMRGYVLGLGNPDTIRIEFINHYNIGARVLLKKYPPFKEHQKDGGSGGLIVVGMSRLGENLIVEAARKWHFTEGIKKEKLSITIIDKDAIAKKESLSIQYPRIEKYCYITPINVDINSAGFKRPEFLKSLAGTPNRPNVYVCTGDDALSMSTSLFMLPHMNGSNAPIVLCMNKYSGLTSLLSNIASSHGHVNNVKVFEMLNRINEQEVLLRGLNGVIARAIHDTYIEEQVRLGVTPDKNSSMLPWDDLPEDLKESNMRSANHIFVKLNSIGCDIMPLNDWDVKPMEFTLEEIEKMSIMEHDRWVEERVLQGYRYAPGPKDVEKKTSPYIVAWEELPEDIREYDRNIVRGISSFLAKEGFQVYRTAKT